MPTGGLRLTFIWIACLSPVPLRAADPISPLNIPALHETALLGDPRFQHGGQFNTIQFSPDNKQVFLGGETMSLWDLAIGKKLDQFDPVKFGVNWSRLIPGTTKCVYEFGTGPAMLKSDLVLADMQSGKELWRIHHDAALIGLAVTNDGQKIITGDDKGRIIFWDANTAKELRCNQMAETPYRLDLSPDQKTLIWRDNKGFTGFVHMADNGGDPGIDLVRMKLVDEESLLMFAASTDRQTAAMVTQKSGVLLVDVRTSTIRWTQKKLNARPVVAKYSPDDKFLGVACDTGGPGVLLLLNAREGTEISRINLTSYFSAFAFSPDSKEIFTDQHGCLARFDIATGKQLFPVNDGELSGVVNTIVPTADDSGFFFSNAGLGTGRWNVNTGQHETIFAPTGRAFGSAALSPDESRILIPAAGSNNMIMLDLKTKTKIVQLAALHDPDVAGTDNWVWAGGGKLVSTIDSDHQAVIFDIATKNLLRTGPEKTLYYFFPTADTDVAMSLRSIKTPATRTAPEVTTSTFAFWDTTTGDILADFPIVGGENSSPATPRAFAPNNRIMLMDNGGKLYAYAAPPTKHATPAQLAALQAQLPDLASPDFIRREAATTAFINAGPNADPILSAATLNDLEATQRIAAIRLQWKKSALTLIPLPNPLPAQDADNPIKQVIIHPDGQHFALLRGTAWRGDTITLGEITPTGPKVIREIQNDNGPNSLAFSHNGQKLYVGNRNATISIYTVDGK